MSVGDDRGQPCRSYEGDQHVYGAAKAPPLIVSLAMGVDAAGGCGTGGRAAQQHPPRRARAPMSLNSQPCCERADRATVRGGSYQRLRVSEGERSERGRCGKDGRGNAARPRSWQTVGAEARLPSSPPPRPRPRSLLCPITVIRAQLAQTTQTTAFQKGPAFDALLFNRFSHLHRPPNFPTLFGHACHFPHARRPLARLAPRLGRSSRASHRRDNRVQPARRELYRRRPLLGRRRHRRDAHPCRHRRRWQRHLGAVCERARRRGPGSVDVPGLQLDHHQAVRPKYLPGSSRVSSARPSSVTDL